MGTFAAGQHKQYLIETAHLITELLVEVSTQAAAKAKETMNVPQGSSKSGNNQAESTQETREETGPASVDPPGVSIGISRDTMVEKVGTKVDRTTEASGGGTDEPCIIVPEGF